jgi:hypothetical protein
VIERGQIQKSCDAIYIEQMHFGGTASQAYGDDSGGAQKVVALPRIDGERREQLVIAEDHVRLRCAGVGERVIDADHCMSIKPEPGEETSEMLG